MEVLVGIFVAVVAGTILKGSDYIYRRKGIILGIFRLRKGILNKVLKTKKIKVGVANYPPLSLISSSLDGTGYTASGPSFELFKRVCDKHGIEIEIMPVQWHELKNHFYLDGCDVLLPIFPTEERSEYGSVFGVTHRVGLGGVCRKKDDRFTSENALQNAEVKVAVTDG